MIQFHAVLHRVTVDREGESTVAFKIPQSDLAKAAILLGKTERVLIVTVDEENQ